MNRLKLCVTYHAIPGMAKAFTDEAGRLLPQIRREKGCRQYDYFFSAEDPDLVLLVEEWDSEEDQQRHLAQPHMNDLRTVKERFIRQTTVQKFIPLD